MRDYPGEGSTVIDSERRVHPRYTVDMPIEYWRPNSTQSRAGRAGDISEGGVLLYVPERILASQNIRVKVYTGKDLEFIESLGQTTWNDSHFVRKDYFHRTGVKFSQISAENLGRLKSCLLAQKNLQSPSELSTPPGVLLPVGMTEAEKKKELERGDQPSEEEKRESVLLYSGETDAFHEAGDEGDDKLPPELIYEFQEEYTDAQRESLYRRIGSMSVPDRYRLAVFANREARNFLIHDPNKMICLTILKNTKLSANEVFQYAQRRHISPDVLQAIAGDQKWKKNYPIKYAVVSNPKTPLSAALNLLPHLHEKDLRMLSRGTNVSSVLSRRAEEILNKKNQK